MSTIVETMPLMMLASITCALISFWFLYEQLDLIWFLPWTSATCLVACLGMLHANKNRKRSDITSASKRVYKKATLASLLLGGLWALFPALFYGQLGTEYQLIVLSVVSGMLGGGVISLYIFPGAMLLWLALITTGCAVALLISGGVQDVGVLCLLLVYSISLCKGGYSLGRVYVRNEISKFKLEAQSETISVVLKDFSDNASDWLWQTDIDTEIKLGAEEFSKVLHAEMSSFCVHDISRGNERNKEQVINRRSISQLCEKFLQQESFRDVVISSSGVNGKLWISLSGKPIFDNKNEFAGFRGVASDITEAKLAEERIAYLAHNDALTGLVNRSQFNDDLTKMLERNQLNLDWSVFYLDLDGFKNVNDTFGHGVGDKLLSQVATRLRKNVSEEDIVARLGGDEFAILCRSAGSVNSVSALADKLVQNMCQPFEVNGHLIETGVSIGVALSAQSGASSDSILYNADLALYRAKADGRGTFRLYEHEMDEIAKQRRSLETDLRMALRNGELSLSYQPLVSSDNLRTTGFEALARWNHPVRGNVPPSDFIPVAERMGVISEIGDWVIREACREANTWSEHLTIAVNLSPHQFLDNKIIPTVTEALKNSGLNPARLELEITEGLFMDKTEEVMFALRELKSMGVSIAMDDFGTGYSSLSYLLKFPFDKLKIDRSFIASINEDEVAKNVLEAITKLGNVLDLKVTAEGVETSGQADLLHDMNCTHYQGYLFGKPLTQDQLAGHMLRDVIDSVEGIISEPEKNSDVA